MNYFVGKNKTFFIIYIFCFLTFFTIKASNFDWSDLLSKPSYSKRFEAIFNSKKKVSKKSFISSPVFLAATGGAILSTGAIIFWFCKNLGSRAVGGPDSGGVAGNALKEKESDSVSSVQTPLVTNNLGSVKAKRKLFEDAIAKAQAKDTVKKNSKFNSPNIFVKKSEDIDKVDEYGRTQLHRASMFFQMSVITELVNSGAEINKPDKDGSTPLLLVARKTSYYRPEESIEAIKYFIENGADINKGDNSGKAAIHIFSKDRNGLVIKFLVNNGANVNLKTKDNMTPLHYYFVGENYFKYRSDSLEFLIKHGAVVDNPDNEGRTPLHFCSMSGSVSDLKILLNNGANIEKEDINGRTPLYYALSDNHFEIVKYLVKRGANVNQSDSNGKSCLDLAKEKCDKEFLKLVFNIEDKKLSEEVFRLESGEEIPDDNCSICLDSLRCKAGENCNGGVCKIECNHFFHKNCINAWFLENETCPNCRAKQEKRFY